MSLIESALQKLRRIEDRSTATAVLPTHVTSTTAPLQTTPAIAVPILEPARRIAVDANALRLAGYLPEEGLERRFADHYRQIKRPLVEKALAGDGSFHRILVSSALPGDGKTFTSINLALSMARERDISVLLVDADAPKAHVSHVFGLRGERGLLDALSDETAQVESLVVGTDVNGFEILPAGKSVENATELLASERMNRVASLIAARNPRQLVVFDTAPLLVSSEARALMRLPGQIVLVVRVGVTPRQALVEALTHIDKRRLQGIVLNQAPHREGGGYYAYGDYGSQGGSVTS